MKNKNIEQKKFTPEKIGLCDNCNKHPIPINNENICRKCFEIGIISTHLNR